MKNRDNITIIAYVNNIATTTDSISTTVTTFAMANGTGVKLSGILNQNLLTPTIATTTTTQWISSQSKQTMCMLLLVR